MFTHKDFLARTEPIHEKSSPIEEAGNFLNSKSPLARYFGKFATVLKKPIGAFGGKETTNSWLAQGKSV